MITPICDINVIIYALCVCVTLLQKTEGDMANLNLGELDLTTDEFILDEVDSKAACIIHMSVCGT